MLGNSIAFLKVPQSTCTVCNSLVTVPVKKYEVTDRHNCREKRKRKQSTKLRGICVITVFGRIVIFSEFSVLDFLK